MYLQNTMNRIGIFILIALLKDVCGKRCFNCSSLDNSLCGDPFHRDARFFVTCLQSCQKKVTNKIVERSCGKSEPVMPVTTRGSCVKQTLPFEGEVIRCECNTIGCNSTSQNIIHYHQLVWIAILNLICLYIL